jgi:carboxypeptidase PM20D1
VHEVCELKKLSSRSLLYKWQGRSHDAPTVLMSHYDVVSVTEENWEKPPFGGVIEDGFLWGRGTLDTKGTLNGIMCSAEALIADGFVPEHDIYFAFGGNEEINGDGASIIVDYFKENGITPAVVIDEGGAVVEKVFPGVKEPCALIGIAEKGMLNVEYTVKGGGGHASSPKPKTPVGRLSRACIAVEGKPFKFSITKPAAALFDTVGRHSTFMYRMIFANLWLFSPVLNILTKLTGGEMNALMRTTTAFTMMEGSKGVNVIPPYARMASNHRIIPGETRDTLLKRIKKRTAKTGVEVSVIDGMDPSVVSTTDCEGYDRLRSVIKDTWPEAIVSPYLMVACSDSRHWGKISDRVYRFSAMALSAAERATVHGNDERIPIETIGKIVEFYLRMMKRS